MKQMFCIIITLVFCSCSTHTMMTDGSITVTTNGLVEKESDSLIVVVNIDGEFEMQIKDATGKSVLIIDGNGPTKFTFVISSTFQPGSYSVFEKDVKGNISYMQGFSI